MKVVFNHPEAAGDLFPVHGDIPLGYGTPVRQALPYALPISVQGDAPFGMEPRRRFVPQPGVLPDV